MAGQEWKQYLVQQASLHPTMRPQDVYKLVFQAAYGAEHLLRDRKAARDFFDREYGSIKAREEPLFEQVHEKVCRVNMGAWKRCNLPPDWLFQMFLNSANMQRDRDGAEFSELEKIAEEAVREGVFGFSVEEFSGYQTEYREAGGGPVHHSETYRLTEAPAYRLVCSRYIRLFPLLRKMADAVENIEDERRIIVAIDGRCASGKTTMARMLAEVVSAGVVHMDDFFLPGELRTAERLAEPGGNIHYERFREEILPHLKSTGEFTYRRFDCGKMQIGQTCRVPDGMFCIVEGAYSHHPVFGDYADLKIFSDVQKQEQIRRIRSRDGEEMISVFENRWIPMEEHYFGTHHIAEAADLTV